MDARQREIAARRRVEAIKGFYIHLAVFVATMVVLAGIDLAAGGSTWFYWPLLGWGMGVLLHAGLVYGGGWGRLDQWEKRKLSEVRRDLEKAEPDSSRSS